MAHVKPLLAAAFLCEKVLEEKDRVLSAIRIIDTFTVVPPSNLPEGSEPKLAITLLITLKAGDADGDHELQVKLRSPFGKDLKGEYGFGPSMAEGVSVGAGAFLRAPFKLAKGQPETGINMVINCLVPAKEFGVYFFDVFVDDELMTKIPFRLRENAAQ